MLVGGDLGFSRLVLVVVVVVFAPVIGFVVRRKWRLAVARREEIKRLLVFASEEAARAEVEDFTRYVAATPVSTSGQLQYQCAVCFCPTTTRCAQCKAVRYCSGKCQIIHWRQGHKEECRPFTATYQINDVEGGSISEAFKQVECETYGNSFELEGGHCAKSVERVPKGPAFSNSYCSPETVRGGDDTRFGCLPDEKGTGCSSKFTTPSFSEGFAAYTTCSESSVDVTVNRVSSPHHPDRSDGHQSGSTVDGSNELSFSEPSTPSSGFWEGTIDTSRCRNDVPDDSAQSSSSEAGDDSMSDFQSSVNFHCNMARDVVTPLHVQGSDTKIKSYDDHSATLGMKKPIDRATLSEETSKGALKARNSQSTNSETSNHVDCDTRSDSCIFKSRESRCLSSCTSHADPASSPGGHSVRSDASNISSFPSLSTGRSNSALKSTSSTSQVLKYNEVGNLSSSASDEHISSGSGRHSISGVSSSGRVDGAHPVAACSSHFVSYSPNATNGLRTSMRKVVDQLRLSKLSRPLGVGVEIAGKYNNKGLFSYEVFVKFYNWNKVELRPFGLKNCGNSCYANAVLQCLTFTPPLTAYLLQGLHSKTCEKKGWCFTCEFENLILKAKDGNSPLSPVGILSQIHKIGSHLGHGKEEDAHEFLRYSIETMQSVCLKEAGVKASGSLEEESTLIGLTFGGYLRSKIKCMKCGGKSERHERMMDLTVEIEGDIGTLEEALRQFTCTEILDGENKYQCSRCKSYEKAKKKLTVLEAPNVLTIALKRFQSGKFGKLNKAIRFPEILDLAPYMSGTSDKSPIYRLYGVVVHLDVMNAAFSGHYVCYVKNIQNKWFKIDDSTVKPVELERVLTKGAYMLLYARCSPRAPRSIRNSMMPHDPRKPRDPTLKSRSHSTGPSGVSLPDTLKVQTTNEPFNMNQTNFHRIRTIFEDDSSDNSSAFSRSHEDSSSTDSTRGSTCTDDFLDQIFGDLGHNWNSPWRNSSDSDTCSSSSSSHSPSPLPSPLYSRHSPLTNSDHYSSGFPETSGSHFFNTALSMEGHCLRSRIPSRSSQQEHMESRGTLPFLHSDPTRQCRKLASSCRETNSENFGWLNPFDDIKYGASFRRPPRVRTE
ncbi:ubiquitin carboxyl-terminal hydrolase 17-like isoform X2 [Cornus florida]|uniref:ubiquitin carboxyl-terminal hydrolase 17-like isoform X2 n=1 Tax=Cornus florida TaxID=4283 RepID=UPI0028A1B0C0|nr:ubiquitin carboxyl-terminal hydrolase 17-like isoform X2 [Cornus florida]